MEQGITYSRPAGLQGTEVLTVHMVPQCWKVFHTRFTVATIIDAGPTGEDWIYRKNVHRAISRSVCLMEPGEIHANRKLTTGTFFVLEIPEEVVERASAEFGRSLSQIHVRTPQVNGGTLYATMLAFQRSMEKGSSLLERQSRFAACLRLVLERMTETGINVQAPRAQESIFRTVRQIIQDRYDEDVSLEELSHEAGVSSYHLCHVFKERAGISPHAFQTQVRISRARQHLASGVAPAQVAAAVGFYDQSHFIRHFRRQVGVTPSRYQEGFAR